VLLGGRYVGPVLVRQKHGSPATPIVIEAAPGESASIDGYVSPAADGSASPASQWEPASLHDPNAHPEEYVSTRVFGPSDLVNRGGFLDVASHTRLATYSRLENLRSDNETWEPIYAAGDPRSGPDVFAECKVDDTDPACQALPDCAPYPACAPTPPKRYKPAGYRYPWVYMGPGLFFNGSTGRVHIRLSHTHNQVSGLADYQGEVDPRHLALAVAPKAMYALRVEGSSDVLVRNVDLRFGGAETVGLENVTRVAFDHVRFWAGTRAVRMGTSTGVAFRHCLFDGGLPQWHFRNDLKGEYSFMDTSTGRIALDARTNTADSLLLGSGTDQGTVVEHSEFVNGHDLYLVGTGFRFHHNWVHNLNDEALFLDAYPLSDARVHENLVERTLSAVSMAGYAVGGTRYVYRNVFDLREPTAGSRPRNQVDRNVWRYGFAFKSNARPEEGDGPHDVFQNTFIVRDQEGQATYLHYRDSGLLGASRRRFLNNIFVAVNTVPVTDRPLAYLPDPSFPTATDGNDYFRFGYATAPLFRHLDYHLPPPDGPFYAAGVFGSLDALRQSLYFQQSQTTYAPGFEASSLEVDPQLESFAPMAAPAATDDFRLAAASPLRGAAATLPPDLAALDPYAGRAGASDVGCCPHAGDVLRVGIDGGHVVGQPRALSAAFEARLRAPACTDAGASCDTGSLVAGRGQGGHEPNASNTIAGSCADGETGPLVGRWTGNDRIRISTIDGNNFAAGGMVRFEATVWASSAFAADAVDFFYAADARSPSWRWLGTAVPRAAGAQTFSGTYQLPSGDWQAVRVQYRKQAASPTPLPFPLPKAPGACATGGYNDRDDLVFPVAEANP